MVMGIMYSLMPVSVLAGAGLAFALFCQRPATPLSEYSYFILLPTGVEERGVLGVGSILVVILPSCQVVKNNIIAL